jgi:hypothetical protein
MGYAGVSIFGNHRDCPMKKKVDPISRGRYFQFVDFDQTDPPLLQHNPVEQEEKV